MLLSSWNSAALTYKWTQKELASRRSQVTKQQQDIHQLTNQLAVSNITLMQLQQQPMQHERQHERQQEQQGLTLLRQQQDDVYR
jgi:hypothetical protein